MFFLYAPYYKYKIWVVTLLFLLIFLVPTSNIRFLLFILILGVLILLNYYISKVILKYERGKRKRLLKMIMKLFNLKLKADRLSHALDSSYNNSINDIVGGVFISGQYSLSALQNYSVAHLNDFNVSAFDSILYTYNKKINYLKHNISKNV